MKILLKRCAGLDVHKETVVACARLMVRGRAEHVLEQFGTTTSELLRLADWLLAQGCHHAALEATGVYWKPVWHILEGQIELTLANAMEVRNVPGRKSDVSDAAWLADLLAHGLIRGSFVPPRPIQELRDLTRTRKQLSRQVAQATQRIEKVLEDANLKITGVITHLLGVSGRAILHALVEGETDPERLLARTNGRLKAPRARLIEGLRGAVTDHHRFQLRLYQSRRPGMFIAKLQIRMIEKGDDMKRTGFGGILAFLLCLGLVSLEARGDDLERFLAQLQSEAASTPLASRPAKPSGVTSENELYTGSCSAYVSCPDGENWVECEGYEYCESRSDVCWVLCDGEYSSCPICW
jgi:transposase